MVSIFRHWRMIQSLRSKTEAHATAVERFARELNGVQTVLRQINTL